MDRGDVAVNDAGPELTGQKRSKYIFGYLLAGAGLVWVFHDIKIGELWGHMACISWGLAILGLFFDTLCYCCQGLRWNLLLRPIGRLPVLRTIQAVFVGLFINEFIPMRLGEVVRGYLVSRWIPAKFISVLPSIIVERLFDAVWLSVGIGLTAMFLPLPKNLVHAGNILGAVVLSGAGLFIYLLLRKKDSFAEPLSEKRTGSRLLRLLGGFIRHLAQGLKAIGLTGTSYTAFGVSIFVMGFQILSFWTLTLSYGFHLSFWAGAAVLLIIVLGTAIPNAPANVGSFQFFCVLGLTLFGVDKTAAAAFSLVVFFLFAIPFWGIGFLALSYSGMTFSTIRSEIKRLRTIQDQDR
jgi:hypothetical protein